ncbi:hypothetical protein HUT18_25620 [Streptomyces sp. NA04227]|uniref:hypothetical protein n=1 Tax=Streptomyces sp. NA04227 TaxID=2742136 RepID=UPI001591ECC9|nr:hypothetical protein [Streptomyces sp. NA04227]QKW09258.1 hypothetical protein HUT18_25620 [Streptomyces sp. NA04227]
MTRIAARLLSLAAGGVLFLGSVGCAGADGAGDDRGSTSAEAPPSGSAKPTGQQEEQEEKEGKGEQGVIAGAVSLDVSGGFAGVRRGITVTPDGEVRVRSREGERTARALDGTEQRTLAALLAEVDFGEVPARSISEQLRDGFQYRLRYEGHSVLTDRTTSLGPVDRVIDHLEKCLRGRGREAS